MVSIACAGSAHGDRLDYSAARLQLEELQLRWQVVADSRLALQLTLQEQLGVDTPSDRDNPGLLQSFVDESEEQQLQQQIASLSQFITVAADQQAALNSVQDEEAQQVASLQLASALQAKEEWDATVLRPHDAALARAIAGCSSTEWDKRGDQLQNPIDLTGRPAIDPEPCDAGGVQAQCSADVKLAPQHETGSCSKHTQGLEVATSSQGGGGGGSADACDHGVQCGICFESFPADSMYSATLPAVMASSSRAAGRCNHKFCTTCMQQYVSCEVQARKIPIYCPDPGCEEEFAASDVLQLLAGKPEIMQVYQAVEAEQLIDTAKRVYCPYKDCSVLLERPDGEGEGQQGQEAPFECPVCYRSFCLDCGIAGWHTGMSCSEFQDLPPDLKSAEDAAALHLAKQKQWKSCPNCRHVVERTVGCNHMRCRCGCDFCYACGSKYTSRDPSATNEHGTQACKCDLFQVPDEAGPVAAVPAVPVVLHQARVYGRPFRNGRNVSHTRCRHADSIHDCPHGPDRCWFWHDEDDD